METLLLHAVIFAAAVLQGVTGIGFAMIAAPAILLAVGDASALQIAAIHSFLITVVLFPMSRGSIDRPRLRLFVPAAAIGLPVGFLFLSFADIDALKLLCGALVTLLAAMMIFGAGDWIGTEGRRYDQIGGAISGFFGGSLSMLGPAVSLRLTAARVPKAQNRATVMAFFLIGYPFVMAGQSLVAGIETSMLLGALALAPATLAGALVGHLALPYVSELVFRWIVVIFQAAMGLTLLRDVMGG